MKSLGFCESIPISDKIITIAKPVTDTGAGHLYAEQVLGNWFLLIMGSFGLLLIIGIISLIEIA